MNDTPNIKTYTIKTENGNVEISEISEEDFLKYIMPGYKNSVH